MKLKTVMIILVILILIAAIVIVLVPENSLNIIRDWTQKESSEEVFEGVEYPDNTGTKSPATRQSTDGYDIEDREISVPSYSIQGRDGATPQGSDVTGILKTIEEVNKINKLNREGNTR